METKKNRKKNVNDETEVDEYRRSKTSERESERKAVCWATRREASKKGKNPPICVTKKLDFQWFVLV